MSSKNVTTVRYFFSASDLMAKTREPDCETWYKHDDDADLWGYME